MTSDDETAGRGVGRSLAGAIVGGAVAAAVWVGLAYWEVVSDFVSAPGWGGTWRAALVGVCVGLGARAGGARWRVVVAAWVAVIAAQAGRGAATGFTHYNATCRVLEEVCYGRDPSTDADDAEAAASVRAAAWHSAWKGVLTPVRDPSWWDAGPLLAAGIVAAGVALVPRRGGGR